VDGTGHRFMACDGSRATELGHSSMENIKQIQIKIIYN
jgi:hypothetical protein